MLSFVHRWPSISSSSSAYYLCFSLGLPTPCTSGTAYGEQKQKLINEIAPFDVFPSAERRYARRISRHKPSSSLLSRRFVISVTFSVNNEMHRIVFSRRRVYIMLVHRWNPSVYWTRDAACVRRYRCDVFLLIVHRQVVTLIIYAAREREREIRESHGGSARDSMIVSWVKTSRLLSHDSFLSLLLRVCACVGRKRERKEINVWKQKCNSTTAFTSPG